MLIAVYLGREVKNENNYSRIPVYVRIIWNIYIKIDLSLRFGLESSVVNLKFWFFLRFS